MSAFFSLCASTQINAPSHTINLLWDFNPTRRKNPLSLKTKPHPPPSPRRGSWGYEDYDKMLIIFFQFPSPRRGVRGEADIRLVFSVFRFCCSSRKAVFGLWRSEVKLTWIRWFTDWIPMGETHEQQKRVFVGFLLSTKLTKNKSAQIIHKISWRNAIGE